MTLSLIIYAYVIVLWLSLVLLLGKEKMNWRMWVLLVVAVLLWPVSIPVVAVIYKRKPEAF